VPTGPQRDVSRFLLHLTYPKLTTSLCSHWYEPSDLSPLSTERAKNVLAKGASSGVNAETRELWEESLEIATSLSERRRWREKAKKALEKELRREAGSEEGSWRETT